MPNLKRPNFLNAWSAFMEVRLPVKEVGRKIGGHVQKNTEIDGPRAWRNACPIRMSYVLNKTGAPIPRSGRYAMVSGGDRMQYIFRVTDMQQYLNDTFGKPEKTVKSPSPEDFRGMRGIIVVKGQGWGDASGHVTLWDGSHCSDNCHLLNDPDNGAFVPESASIWELR